MTRLLDDEAASSPRALPPPSLSGLPRAEKLRIRRDELADAALQTLAELGYERATLREIARRTSLSHGVVHYYFADKGELISYCVRRYKETCSRRYDTIVADADSADELRSQFSVELARTMVDEGGLHALWYDLRAHSAFEEDLRVEVQAIDDRLEQMIWSVFTRYLQLLPTRSSTTSTLAYATFDGLFAHCLYRHRRGDVNAATHLREQAAVLLDQLARRDS